MTAPPDDTTTDFHAVIAALRTERDAALTREAVLGEELATRTAELAQRNTDYREQIEHQAATIDVLKVMSASPGDPQPVFDLIARQARKQCNTVNAGFYEYDGMIHFRSIASSAFSSDAVDVYARRFPMPLEQEPNNIATVCIRDRRIVHIRDANAEGGLSASALGLGIQSAIAIPLIRGDAAIGCIAMSELRTGGYSDSQIDLLRTFAEQAVIAISSAETYRALQERTEALATRNSEYGEQIEHQSATIDVLKAMSSSPDDPQPAFDLIVQRAQELCNGWSAGIADFDGELIHLRAWHGPDPAAILPYASLFPMALTSGSLVSRAIRERQIVHVRDADAEPEILPSVRDMGLRSLLAIPLLRDGGAIGVIALTAMEPGGFSKSQVELLQTFAEQAVIAIGSAETYRALQTRTNDLQESLEYQTATSDVLKVISVSAFDLQAVLDSLVASAARLCNAEMASIIRCEGDLVRLMSNVGLPADFVADRQARGAMRPNASTVTGKVVRGGCVIHVHDVAADPDYPEVSIRVGRQRSSLGIPLSREGEVIGVILLARQRVEPFTDRQIELVSTFADQAVIAMENARLLGELRQRTADLQETLEYQTATSDVLKVISRSTFDLKPVLATVAEAAARLCVADQAAIYLVQSGMAHLATNFGFPPEYEATIEKMGTFPIVPDSPSVGYRAVAERRIVHIHDVAAIQDYPETPVKLGKQRTSLGVPLLRDSETVGLIMLARQRVEPFTDRQIELVSTFADQAVIAIENTRLITEQREALEQQTATAEVLQVINASPGYLTPVFDAMLEKALSLCESPFGLLSTYDGEVFHNVAMRGATSELAEYLSGPVHVTQGQALQRIVHGGEDVVHEADITEEEGYGDGNPNRHAMADLGGARTQLVVALRKDDVLLGVICIFRQVVRPFTDKQIALLQTFAAQAVIAMENARLLGELRQRTDDLQESLEYQTATSDVLKAISQSQFDLQPVLEALVATAAQLCGAEMVTICRREGEGFRVMASLGLPAEFAADPRLQGVMQFTTRTVLGRAIRERRAVQVPDASAEPDYTEVSVKVGRVRTSLGVPLLREGEVIGVLGLARQRVEPFTDRQVELVSTFADQAVIAMENARLITEQKEALEQQTATAEVLQVINASPGNLAPVFDAILEKAHDLCGATKGVLVIHDGEHFRAVATRGLSEEYLQLLRQPSQPRPDSPRAQLLSGVDLVHHIDVAQHTHPTARAAFELEDVRTVLFVPLRRDGALLGYITAYRLEVRPFAERQISLLKNFAAQAVVAMENARLLDEIRQRQEELRITFENMGDGVAMFDETQHLVAWNGKFQEIFDVPDALLEEHRTYAEYVRYLGTRGDFGPTVDVEEQIRSFTEIAGEYHAYERVRPDGRVIEIRHNPVAGGGFVLIYADITERKRSEAEIRAARDAAEEASHTIEAAYRDLKAAQANLIQAEKMASLGQLTAGIAHEIKNPLNFVNNFAALSVDLLSELKETAAPGFAALTEKQRAEVEDVSAMLTSNLEKINEHGKRADGIVKAMLEHSRGSSGERRMVDLNALIDEALNLAYHGARAQNQSFNISLERDFGEGIAPIEVNPQDVTRVFLNIFANGFYATTRRARDGGDAGFEPTLKVTTRDAGEAVEIRVRDNGTGIPADIRDKLFQPFFTTKPTGEGTGLGLSITYDIVTQQHGGSIAVDSMVGEYSEFTIQLPRNP